MNELIRIDDVKDDTIYAFFHPVVKVWVRCYVKSLDIENDGIKYNIFLPDYSEYHYVATSAVREFPPDFKLKTEKSVDVVLEDFNFHKLHHEHVIMELNLYVGKLLRADVKGIDVFGNLIVCMFDFDRNSFIFGYIRDRIEFHRR